MRTLKLDLGDDAAVFVEVQPSVGGEDRFRPTADGDTRLETNFDRVSGSLSRIVESINRQLSLLPARPDKLELEMGAQLRGEADLWLVSGEAEAHIKVTMSWGK